jgi:glycosyltransferase involved in cell wall biosynthesis
MMLPGNDLQQGNSLIHPSRNRDSFHSGIAIHWNGIHNWYPARIFRLRRQQFYLNCVSSSQQKACPSRRLLLPIIHNGVDVARLGAVNRTKQNYVLALGRICPEKAFHLALDAAKRANVECVLAGEVAQYADHKRYFRTKIAPRLDERRQFIGPVNFETKRRLLSEARCLLVTSEVQETSSLVAMEALAAGTPVIAFPTGALAEIVEQGRTGFLAANVGEMAKAIGAVDRLIRKSAETQPAAVSRRRR